MKDEEHYISVSYGFQIIEDVQTETSEYFEWAESTFGYSVNGLKKHIASKAKASCPVKSRYVNYFMFKALNYALVNV